MLCVSSTAGSGQGLCSICVQVPEVLQIPIVSQQSIIPGTANMWWHIVWPTGVQSTNIWPVLCWPRYDQSAIGLAYSSAMHWVALGTDRLGANTALT